MGNTSTTEGIDDEGPLEQGGIDNTTAIQRMDKEIRQKLHAKGVKYNMKVLVRGERETGKSCLVSRLQGEPFQAQIQTATIKFPEPGNFVDDDAVKVEIWDVVDNADAPTSQQLELQQLQEQGSGGGASNRTISLDAESVDVYHDAHACILMLDPRSNSGFDYITRILPHVPTEVSVLLILCFRDTQTNKESAEAMLRVKSILEGDGEKSMAQRRRHVRILEASMKDGYGLQGIYSFLSIPFYNLKCLTLKKQLDMETGRLQGIEETFDNILLNSDYSQYLEEETMNLDHHRHADVKEPSSCSSGGKSKAAAVTVLTEKDDSCEISATVNNNKSTFSPPSSPPASSPNIDCSLLNSQNQNENESQKATEVVSNTTSERRPSKRRGERRTSKHKNDKKEHKHSKGVSTSSPSSRRKSKHRHRSSKSKNAAAAVVNDTEGCDDNEKGVICEVVGEEGGEIIEIVHTGNKEDIGVVKQQQQQQQQQQPHESCGVILSSSSPLVAASLPVPSTDIDDEPIVNRNDSTSSSDDEDMPTFSRLRRVLATDIQQCTTNDVKMDQQQRHSFDTNINNSSTGTPTIVAFQKEEGLMQQSSRKLVGDSNDDDVNSSSPPAADIKHTPPLPQNNSTSSPTAEETKMENITADDNEIMTMSELKVVLQKNQSDESSSNSNNNALHANNGKHVVVKEDRLGESSSKYGIQDDVIVVTEAVGGGSEDENSNRLGVGVLANADDKEEDVMKGKVFAAVDDGGHSSSTEPQPFEEVAVTDGRGENDVVVQKILLPTTITTENEDIKEDMSDDILISKFCPEIDIDSDFFNDSSEDCAGDEDATDDSHNEDGEREVEELHLPVRVDRRHQQHNIEQNVENSTETFAITAEHLSEDDSSNVELDNSTRYGKEDDVLSSNEDIRHLEEEEDQLQNNDDTKSEADFQACD